jgi:hypothetical protein
VLPHTAPGGGSERARTEGIVPAQAIVFIVICSFGRIFAKLSAAAGLTVQNPLIKPSPTELSTTFVDKFES